MKVIGVAGFAGSGKGMVTDMIVDMTKKTTRVASFADPIREAVTTLFGHHLQQDSFADRTKKESPIETISSSASPRDLMKGLGSEFGRHFHQDIWVEHADGVIRTQNIYNSRGYHHNKYDYMVFDDLRFENEYNMIRRHGGCMVIVIGGVNESNWSFLGSSKHESEVGLFDKFDPEFDFIIDNRHSIDYTAVQVERLVENRFMRGVGHEW